MSLDQTFICSYNERELKRVILGHILLFKLEFLESVPSANLCTPTGEDRRRELHPNDKQMKIKTANVKLCISNLVGQNSSAVTLAQLGYSQIDALCCIGLPQIKPLNLTVSRLENIKSTFAILGTKIQISSHQLVFDHQNNHVTWFPESFHSWLIDFLTS